MIDNIIEIIEIKAEQISLKIIVCVAQILSKLIVVFLLCIFSLFFLFFLSFAVVEVINMRMDSRYMGFFIIAGAYLLVIISVLFLIKSGKLKKWTKAVIVKLEEARYAQKRDN